MFTDETPLVDGFYVLEKFPGKGGWTYAEIPELVQDKTKPFGWLTVKGTVDGYVLNQFKLMPMGNGKLFLPVKKAIRKVIGKEAGDTVKVILYNDSSLVEIPSEILTCFDFEPERIEATFKSYSQGEQKAFLDWIYSAKTEETKVARILTMIQKLEKGLKWQDNL